jgi:2-succinyl-6-hydroxy-2,4-cyclohexadiene-1-carboxylate synthase
MERQARREADEALARRIEEEGVEAFVAFWETLPLFASQARLREETRRELRARRLRNRPEGLAGSLRGMGTGSQPSLWERLGELQPRTLLIAGELDEKFCSINRRMAAAIPGAQLHIAPGAGHTVHLEQPEWYADVVAGSLLHGDPFWQVED